LILGIILAVVLIGFSGLIVSLIFGPLFSALLSSMPALFAPLFALLIIGTIFLIIAILILPHYLGEKKVIKSKRYSLKKVKK